MTRPSNLADQRGSTACVERTPQIKMANRSPRVIRNIFTVYARAEGVDTLSSYLISPGKQSVPARLERFEVPLNPTHELESGKYEALVERGDQLALRGIHNGHAHGIGVRDTVTGELFQPGTSRLVMRGLRKLESDQRARFDPIDRGKR